MASHVLTDTLSAPLNGTTTAKVDINTEDANLTIDRLTGGDPLLASGTLQYVEDRGLPARTLNSGGGQAMLTLKGVGSARSLFHLPWATASEALEWQIHLNPTVPSDINARSGGGNLKLDLTGMAVTHVFAETGGGNVELVLPDNAANLNVSAGTGGGSVILDIGSGTTGSNTIDAHSGAGNVVIHVPEGIAARIHATTGFGKAIVDPRFSKVDRATYQSPDFDVAANKVEITLGSGAGNVSVDTK